MAQADQQISERHWSERPGRHQQQLGLRFTAITLDRLSPSHHFCFMWWADETNNDAEDPQRSG